jgi:hypothetical protein
MFFNCLLFVPEKVENYVFLDLFFLHPPPAGLPRLFQTFDYQEEEGGSLWKDMHHLPHLKKQFFIISSFRISFPIYCEWSRALKYGSFVAGLSRPIVFDYGLAL